MLINQHHKSLFKYYCEISVLQYGSVQLDHFFHFTPHPGSSSHYLLGPHKPLEATAADHRVSFQSIPPFYIRVTVPSHCILLALRTAWRSVSWSSRPGTGTSLGNLAGEPCWGTLLGSQLHALIDRQGDGAIRKTVCLSEISMIIPLTSLSSAGVKYTQQSLNREAEVNTFIPQVPVSISSVS